MSQTELDPKSPVKLLGYSAESPVQHLLAYLLNSSLVLAEDWEILPLPTRDRLLECTDISKFLSLLQEHTLLTAYQVGRIQAGATHGLILGNYRVVGRIGAGAMGVVFKAEHCRMRRLVAIKVLPEFSKQDHKLLMRFLTEMRSVAQLQHPNIVGAIDAGEVAGKGPDDPVLHYFAMEYVPGEDLHDLVTNHGQLPVVKACDFAYQIATPLAEAHKHNLVHRDIKPSNVRITPEGQAKLLDFGLARHFRRRHTEPGILLGTMEYMAPEQAQNAAAVDIRADIHALGGTLFWCLAGRPPFPTDSTLIQSVARRVKQQPPSIRSFRPDVPIELEAVLLRMMALKPEDRYTTPQAVMQALIPFLKPELHEHHNGSLSETISEENGSSLGVRNRVGGQRILVVDDEVSVREFCRIVMEADGLVCTQAVDGVQALEIAKAEPFDLVLLDIDMPKMKGTEVLRRLHEHPPNPNQKIIMFSGRASPDEMAKMLVSGADGYLTKPFSVVQLGGQVKAALRLKEAQDYADRLNRRLLSLNAELERGLSARDGDLVHARDALVQALAVLLKHRDGETGAHVWRLQLYSRSLAETAAGMPRFADQIDPCFIDLLEFCAPLHDIGKVGIPDLILLKPGKLTRAERTLMESHTTMGAETLQEVAEHHGSALVFLKMAIEITRHHHERYDGTGYPDRLAGENIPLAARIVAVGDVYDALRSQRVYKPALSHTAAVKIMTEESPGHFDLALIQAFHRCAGKFESIFRELNE